MPDSPLIPPPPRADGRNPPALTRVLTVKVDGEARVVRWDALTEGRVHMEVDGQSREFEAQRLSDGRWLLREGASQVVVDVDGRLPKGVATVSSRDGEARAVSVELVPPVAGQSVLGSSATEAKGPLTLRAMMPGRVVKVLVEAGQAVRAGQALLVVEAMKMQNDLICPRDGKILALHCAEGGAVEAHQELVSIG